MLPRAASDYDRGQERQQLALERQLRRSWRKMRGRNWGTAWRDHVGPEVNLLIAAAQAETVDRAAAYVPKLLSETGDGSRSQGSLVPGAFIGVAGDGRPVESLTLGAVVTAGRAMPETATRGAETVALLAGERWLIMSALTTLSDTARAVETTASAQRRVTGYVRMVSPGACSRCVILAGKWFRSNQGFLRHPKCHCRHIPASEDVAGSMLTNPSAYFEGLSREQQDKVFTKAGAEAIRLGADPSQVVNARRGMTTAQTFGRSAFATTEGVTARGVAGKSLGNLMKVAGQRYRISQVPRLMPETILAEAKDPADAIRLLRRFGYIT